ncbi:XTP/dITP diphosphatase [Acidianus manzaensis]|uniref:dITP/XTP pyrophosphatase n=1 Tax=Acidianus manzaensis TaxID=282676 RepID=A0A1W6JZS6_9CREN|nr:XTP/dITP diphosphatase [Acidianus manzaensis]ARM75793.1 non-canonical purine NTP pyrophosphatase, RdgB/HAM1 family [Acidianus manzaensis]
MSKKEEIKIVTGNKRKFEELNEIAKEYNLKLSMIDLPKFEIQADTLEEVVRHAASVIYTMLHEPIILEDSGLFIESLNGFPGPYTKFAKQTIDINGILKLMTNIENRKAYFKTALAYVDEYEIKIFTGEVHGKISYEAKGDKGFGFDPIFIPDGCEKTFAELNIQEKNQYSHRSRAFRKFLEYYL